MARSHLTLAALATAAIPGLDVVAARPLSGGGGGDYDSAVIMTAQQESLVVRIPASVSAQAEQSGQVAALQALTAGVRDQLPFAVPGYRGSARAGSAQAIVSDFLPGTVLEAAGDAPGEELIASIGRGIAAIHALPPSVIRDAGLPVRTCEQSRGEAQELVRQASATGAVPTALGDRWRQALDVDEAWRFSPAVVNGSLDARTMLVAGDALSGVLGWPELAVADPALDLRWAFSLRRHVADALVAAYRAARPTPPDDFLMLRALLYSELQAARWLLYGREVHDTAIVDDATRMLDRLVDRVHHNAATPLQPVVGPILTVADVESMLSEPTRRPHAAGGRSTGLAPVEEFRAEAEPDEADPDEVDPAEADPVEADTDSADTGEAEPAQAEDEASAPSVPVTGDR